MADKTSHTATSVPEDAKPAIAVESSVLAKILSDMLDENKAEEIVTIDLRGKTSIADVMIIASGRSNRQVSALASKCVDLLREEYGIRARSEGQSEGDWVLIDARDVIVHLFRPEVRTFYALEKMWAQPHPDQAPNIRSV
ncbi:MAG TPA: ribosome silencing factor [Alphaproteobacteria bacterium]